jgi:lipid-binding SYLF domain-containing protein
MKKATFLIVTALFLGLAVNAQTEQDKKVITDAEQAKEAFLTKDPTLADHFKNADAYVIFPNVGEGALIVGGAAGNGVVWESSELSGMAKMTKVDVGAQVGGSAYSEVIFFYTQEPLKRFKDDDFELSAGISAVLINDGAAMRADYSEGVGVFVMPKAGLSLEAAVGGQKFTYTPFE